MTKQIPLTHGKIAIVDDADFEWLSHWKWHVTNNGYAAHGNWSVSEHRPLGLTLMHREIMHAPKGTDVDHINHNRLDNRRGNMRLCTRGDNVKNSQGHIHNRSTPYKGVCYDKSKHKYLAGIKINNHRINLGRFRTPEEAARAYDRKSKELFGEFAFLNFPE